MCVVMLALPMTSVLLATLLLFSDGLAVMPLVIVAVVVAHGPPPGLRPPSISPGRRPWPRPLPNPAEPEEPASAEPPPRTTRWAASPGQADRQACPDASSGAQLAPVHRESVDHQNVDRDDDDRPRRAAMKTRCAVGLTTAGTMATTRATRPPIADSGLRIESLPGSWQTASPSGGDA